MFTSLGRCSIYNQAGGRGRLTPASSGIKDDVFSVARRKGLNIVASSVLESPGYALPPLEDAHMKHHARQLDITPSELHVRHFLSMGMSLDLDLAILAHEVCASCILHPTSMRAIGYWVTRSRAAFHSS